MSKKVLVTGATGFLGRHLARNLLDHGYEVVALVRNPGVDMPDGVEKLAGDVHDEASVARAAEQCDGGVFHCAGKVSRRAEDAEELYKVHVQGTKTVFAACKAAGIKRVAYASTSGTVAVSDNPDHIMTESDTTPIALISRWPYYRSKLFAEQWALEQNSPEFQVVSVNPTLLLGPGDINGSSSEDVRLFLERRIPAVPPGGLSYVDARDAADAMRLAFEKGTPGRRYLVGACNVTLREFFARLSRVSGVSAPFVPVPRWPEVARVGGKLLEHASNRFGMNMPIDPISFDMAQFYWYLDATRAETELGWRARDPIETLHDTVRDLRDRGIVWPEPEGAGHRALG
jgi:dihydroflavonol-4-reductase